MDRSRASSDQPAHGASPRGRRRGHDLKPWQILDQYVEWDRAELKARRFTRDKGPFFKHQLGTTFQTGNRLLDDYGFGWPAVPRHDDDNRTVLVYLVYGHPPYQLLWVSDSLCVELGRTRDDLLDQPAMCLRQDEDIVLDEPAHAQLATALQRNEVPEKFGIVENSHLVHADGRWLPVDLRLSYGRGSEAWYAQATVTGPLREPWSYDQDEYVAAGRRWMFDSASILTRAHEGSDFFNVVGAPSRLARLVADMDREQQAAPDQYC